MLLIGQYDSPFVRRVAVALRHHGFGFEHRPHASFRDAELIARYNPLRRVPTLVLDDDTVLTESSVCLEVLDGRVAETRGEDWPQLLLPRRGPLRERGLRASGFLCSALDKAVSLIYERRLRSATDSAWEARCELQLRETLQMLDGESAALPGRFYLGERPSHYDILVGCALTLIEEALPGFLPADAVPHLRSLGQRSRELPAFEGIYLPFVIHT
jgi:glutathione S-transferase